LFAPLSVVDLVYNLQEQITLQSTRTDHEKRCGFENRQQQPQSPLPPSSKTSTNSSSSTRRLHHFPSIYVGTPCPLETATTTTTKIHDAVMIASLNTRQTMSTFKIDERFASGCYHGTTTTITILSPLCAEAAFPSAQHSPTPNLDFMSVAIPLEVNGSWIRF
jgi:hypothetical protein